MAEHKSGVKAGEPKEFRHEPTRDLYGWITHTDLLSNDPAATKQWCAKVFEWKFNAIFPGPTGDYHLFAYSEKAAAVYGQRPLMSSPEACRSSTSKT